MAPKRKEKEAEAAVKSANNKTESVYNSHNDHELFLQVFEKPTQMYRYLRARHLLSPIFLHRTLGYMKGRSSRSHKRDSDLSAVLEKLNRKQSENQSITPTKFMTLTFLGFYNAKYNGTAHPPVKVETLLVKVCHKKRKEASSPIVQISVGTTEVCINPSEDQPPPKVPTVSIASEDLAVKNGQQGNSYVLLLRVSAPAVSNTSDSEPSVKRRRLGELAPPYPTAQPVEVRLYAAELAVYDRHSRCLLIDGDYELALQEVNPGKESNVGQATATSAGSPKKSTATWTTLENASSKNFNLTEEGPTLKFRLQWSDSHVSGLVDRPRPYEAAETEAAAATEAKNVLLGSGLKSAEKDPFTVRYQFLYQANRRQQTVARSDLDCPWCSLHCPQLPALLKHLKLCHPRFLFSHTILSNGEVRVDVTVNDSYDGTYTGNPCDLVAQPLSPSRGSRGAMFARQGPARRTSVTAVLVWRPRRLRSTQGDNAVNLEADDTQTYDAQRPFITGHNRLYHHTSTCLPIQPKELDVDSEDETDPDWLQRKTALMIDEFTDVNEGEKEIMKLWNLHVLKYNYVGDCQMPMALQMFLERHGEELLRRNLYRNFILHTTNLYDFGIIGPATVLRTITSLQGILHRHPELQASLKEAWCLQINTE